MSTLKILKHQRTRRLQKIVAFAQQVRWNGRHLSMHDMLVASAAKTIVEKRRSRR